MNIILLIGAALACYLSLLILIKASIKTKKNNYALLLR